MPMPMPAIDEWSGDVGNEEIHRIVGETITRPAQSFSGDATSG